MTMELLLFLLFILGPISIGILLYIILVPWFLWKQKKRIVKLEITIESLQNTIHLLTAKFEDLSKNKQSSNDTQSIIAEETHLKTKISADEIEEQAEKQLTAITSVIEAKEDHNETTDATTDVLNNVNEDKQKAKDSISPSDQHDSLSEEFEDQNSSYADIETIAQEPERISFEQQFGARLPVWIGGIALALAGFFLVKYSIEHNLITPGIRVFLGIIFGGGLLYLSNIILMKENVANGTRIAQSLAGAGIAILYLSSYAATRLYDFIPTPLGFVSMGAITATALVLCLRHGAPIGLMGMAGGFLTPALLSEGGGSAFSLFIYLYFTASGLLIVIHKTKLWWLAIPTILLSLGWVIVWVFSNRYSPSDSIWLILFLTGISATIIISSRDQFESDFTNSQGYQGIFKITSILNYIGLGGTLMMMGLIAGKAGYGTMEWGLFCLLATAAIGLAYFNVKLYGFTPWIAMAVNCVMLMTWNYENSQIFIIIVLLLSAIYITLPYCFLMQKRTPLLWGSLLGSASLMLYMIAYYKLTQTNAEMPFVHFWGMLAIIITFMMIHILFKIHAMRPPEGLQDKLYAIFSVAATSFLSIGIFIECEGAFLSVAIATEIMALCWINSKVNVKALRPIAIVLSVIFALILSPQILLMFQLTVYSLVEVRMGSRNEIPIVSQPLFQLGIPAVMIMASSYLLRKQKDSSFVHWLEGAFIVMVATTGYYFMRNLMHPDQNVLYIKAGFIERGILTNVLFVYGFICLWASRIFKRRVFSWGGVILITTAIFRILYFDIFLYNPLWKATEIKGTIIANTLFITYALPAFWLYFIKKEIQQIQFIRFFNSGHGMIYLAIFVAIILFAWLNLNIRYMFHEHSITLRHNVTTNMEIYTYSAVWLIVGIAVLFAGLIRQDKILRLTSLSIIVITVAKVFLYDAAALEGLYRVISFLGLGVSLIGLSYFYTRFVFNDTKGIQVRDETHH